MKRIGPGALREWALRFPNLEVGERPIGEASAKLAHENRCVRAVVPHWRAPAWCRETVASLISQRDVDVRLIVVDNSPECGLRLPADVEHRRSVANLGFSGAVNQVLAEWLSNQDTHIGYFLVACHDCVLSSEVVAELVDILDHNPDVGILGPRERSDRPDELLLRTFVSGTCLLLRRECAQDVGLFDEELGTYDEDLDFCLRAWDAGWAVATAPVGQPETNGSVAADRTRRIARNHVVLASKRRGTAGALAEFALQFRRGCIALWRSLRLDGPAEERHRSEATQRWSGALDGLLHLTTRGFSPHDQHARKVQQGK